MFAASFCWIRTILVQYAIVLFCCACTSLRWIASSRKVGHNTVTGTYQFDRCRYAAVCTYDIMCAWFLTVDRASICTPSFTSLITLRLQSVDSFCEISSLQTAYDLNSYLGLATYFLHLCCCRNCSKVCTA